LVSDGGTRAASAREVSETAAVMSNSPAICKDRLRKEPNRRIAGHSMPVVKTAIRLFLPTVVQTTCVAARHDSG
jgi:hypothetical protein